VARYVSRGDARIVERAPSGLTLCISRSVRRGLLAFYRLSKERRCAALALVTAVLGGALIVNNRRHREVRRASTA
jgi:uncharacterized membrane protein